MPWLFFALAGLVLAFASPYSCHSTRALLARATSRARAARAIALAAAHARARASLTLMLVPVLVCSCCMHSCCYVRVEPCCLDYDDYVHLCFSAEERDFEGDLDSAFMATLIWSSSCTASYGKFWHGLGMSFIELDFGLRLVRHLMHYFVVWLRYLLYRARLACVTLLQ